MSLGLMSLWASRPSWCPSLAGKVHPSWSGPAVRPWWAQPSSLVCSSRPLSSSQKSTCPYEHYQNRWGCRRSLGLSFVTFTQTALQLTRTFGMFATGAARLLSKVPGFDSGYCQFSFKMSLAQFFPNFGVHWIYPRFVHYSVFPIVF